ncbi:MAG: NAD(P)H-hydrate epimerase [Planctomycetes bacterium]|nr:NAD(P)H-hydrate epimerase [Planctomycetota bacterium]
MSVRSLTREEVRAVDRRAIDEFGMTGLVLMENAGRGAAERLLALGVDGPVIVCAGKGNNGGDGFVIARHLELLGCDARVLLFANPSELSGDAAVNWRILEAAETPRVVLGRQPPLSDIDHALSHADWIVDALLGTGTLGEVREPYRTAIAAINRSARKVLAVDLPSGLDCDTGEPIETLVDGIPVCVRAAHTATFVARKRGFDLPTSQAFTGDVHVVGIGAPKKLIDEVLSASELTCS